TTSSRASAWAAPAAKTASRPSVLMLCFMELLPGRTAGATCRGVAIVTAPTGNCGQAAHPTRADGAGGAFALNYAPPAPAPPQRNAALALSFQGLETHTSSDVSRRSRASARRGPPSSGAVE